MKSSYLFLLFMMMIVMSSCANKRSVAQTEVTAAATVGVPVQFQELTGYFVKNTYTPVDDVNPLVIKNQAQFNELFGVGKTMNNTIISPDFEKSIVVALIFRSTNKATTITLSDSKIDKGTLDVYYIAKTGAEQSYTSTPVALSTIDRAGVTNVRFFVNGKEKGIVVL